VSGFTADGADLLFRHCEPKAKQSADCGDCFVGQMTSSQ